VKHIITRREKNGKNEKDIYMLNGFDDGVNGASINDGLKF
jgi:hypothetical protein